MWFFMYPLRMLGIERRSDVFYIFLKYVTTVRKAHCQMPFCNRSATFGVSSKLASELQDSKYLVLFFATIFLLFRSDVVFR